MIKLDTYKSSMQTLGFCFFVKANVDIFIGVNMRAIIERKFL